MFLKDLNKNESVAFVSLVKDLAKVDKTFSQREKILIDDYIKELYLTNKDIENLTFQKATEILNQATTKVKNIVYFELIGLALVDGVYEKEEIDYLNHLAHTLNINKGKQKQMLDFFKEIKEIYDITVVDYEGKLAILKEKAINIINQ